ncbi:MAG: ABC transporter substrate-binding protein [bacterium]
MKRKNWHLLLSAIFLLALLAVPMEAKVTLKYWTLFTGPDGETMKFMVDKFNAENPNIYVDFSITNWENYYNQLTAAIAGGNAPDVAIVHTRNLPAFASERILYAIDEEVAKAGLSEKDFIPVAWKGGSIGGKRYALPLDVIIAMVLYYNTDMFNRAGLSSPPQNGVEYIDYAKKIKATTGNWGALIPLRGFTLYRHWFSGLYQNGGQLLSDDLKRAAFNTPAGVEALSFWVDAVYKHKISPDRDLGEGEGFRFGKVGMELDGIWQVSAFRSQENLSFALASIPPFFKSDNRSFFSNSHNFVFPKPRREDKERLSAAIEFASWLSGNSLIWAERAGQVPARLSVIQSQAYKELPYAQSLLEQVNYAKYPPAIKETSQVQDAIIKALEFAMARKMAPAEALASAEKEVNAILK